MPIKGNTYDVIVKDMGPKLLRQNYLQNSILNKKIDCTSLFRL